MRRRGDTDLLTEAARSNWRVFTLAQLFELGLSEKRVRTLVAQGLLHRIHKGVYLYGHPDPAWQSEYLAAQYLAGPGAYLTDGSGLALLKLWRPFTGKIHVGTPNHRRPTGKVKLHRTSTPPQPDEIKQDGPLHYAKLPRLLVDLAPRSNAKQIAGLIHKGVQQDKLDHALMRRVLDRYGSHPHAKLVEAAYAGYLPAPTPKSELEARWNAEFATRPWLPEPLHNHYIEAGRVRWEIDRYWPAHRVGVEIDSRTYHQALRDRAKDELKRAKLLTIGIQTLSVSAWRMEYAVADCLDDLEAILTRSQPVVS